MRGLLGLALTAALLASPAAAEDGGLGGFFSHLFGLPPPPKPTQTAPAVRPSEAAAPRRRPKKPTPVARSESGPPPPAAAATPPPTATQFIYVLGDSLAISAADGMALDLQPRPEIGVVDRARDASGLVRDDYFDWPKAARELVAPGKDGKPTKVDFVFVMVGVNDLQPLKDGKDYVDVLSDRWKAAYAQRIQAVVAPLQAAHVPVVWVGLPPMRNDRVNGEVVALNQLFKENAEKAGAKYVDVFDAFADQSGGFDAFGPNLEGQKVRLRGPDGIHFSAAGGLKLAHFLDPDAVASLAPGGARTDFATLPPDVGKATDDVNEQIRREMTPGAPSPAAPAPPKPEAGAIVSLAARPASPGAALVTLKAAPDGDAERRLRRGDPAPAQPGRADDFSR